MPNNPEWKKHSLFGDTPSNPQLTIMPDIKTTALPIALEEHLLILLTNKKVLGIFVCTVDTPIKVIRVLGPLFTNPAINTDETENEIATQYIKSLHPLVTSIKNTISEIDPRDEPQLVRIRSNTKEYILTLSSSCFRIRLFQQHLSSYVEDNYVLAVIQDPDIS